MKLLVVILLLLGLLATVVYMYVRDTSNLKDRLDMIQALSTFRNERLFRCYRELSEYLKSRKARLSAKDRLEISNMWNNILVTLASDYRYVFKLNEDEVIIENDPLTKAEHKRIVIEELENISTQEYIKSETLHRLAIHMYILLK